MVGEETAGKLTLSTFHAMGAEILRRHIPKLGWKTPFSILDSNDQVAIVKDLMEELGLPDGIKPAEIHGLISRAKNALVEPAGLKMRFNPLIPYAQKVYKGYCQACKNLNGVDFDDLINLPVRLLEQDEEVRQKVQERFQYVMVDEYQDTNETQLRLLKLICSPRNNLCVVGDDDQSIYAFRGAVSKHILEFDKVFPGAKVVKLEQNYRSTTTILQAANGLIGKNRLRREKNLWSDLGQGEKVKFFQLADEDEEAQFVAGDLLRKRMEQGRAWTELAVLFRAATLLRPLEEALREYDIPYQVVGSSEFFDRREVKDIVSYMQAILNPAMEVSLRRIVNVPRRGIGPTTVERLTQFAHAHHIPFMEAMRRAEELADVHASQRAELRNFADLMERARGRFAVEPLDKVMRWLLEEIDYKSHIAQMDKSPDVQRIRQENVSELIESLARFQARHSATGSGLGRLENYLSRLLLDGPSQTGEKAEPQEGVWLMTLHASKGLEFPDVYLVGFEEELLPHARSMEPGQDGDLEEERRLAYVGITRAKRRLVLTAAARRGRGQASRKRTPSRFLEEIPPAALTKQLHGPHSAPVTPPKARGRENLARLRAAIFED
jgi:DNA helicase-2/ATP-dependent DNA helicase PcrA